MGLQWLWWLLGALALGSVEMLTVDFTFLMLAGGALAAMVAALFGLPWWVCVIVFAVASLALLAAVRPLLLSRLKVRGRAKPVTGTAALVGRSGSAVTEIDELGGRVKIEGEVWTSRAVNGQVIRAGALVRVMEIDGATAVVEATVPEEETAK